MKISTEEFSHEIAGKIDLVSMRAKMIGVLGQGGTYISSKGEMKTSLRLMIW